MSGGRAVTAEAAGGVVPRWLHWPALAAALAITLLYVLLPERLRVGPRFLLPIIVIALALLYMLLKRLERHDGARRVAIGSTALLTAAVVSSAASLIFRIPRGTITPLQLLSEAGLVWGGNLLTFAVWYWELDDGGPVHRHLHPYAATDFLFPQVQMAERGPQAWKPDFMDYLFLAFNTSTAFSPTDTLVLSRRMKALMMAQSLISLVVVSVLIARAINTLQS